MEGDRLTTHRNFQRRPLLRWRRSLPHRQEPGITADAEDAVAAANAEHRCEAADAQHGRRATDAEHTRCAQHGPGAPITEQAPPAARQGVPASRGHTADYRGANEVWDSWRCGLETGVRRIWLELHASSTSNSSTSVTLWTVRADRLQRRQVEHASLVDRKISPLASTFWPARRSA